MHLMAGAVGSYKNPHNHRNVVIEPSEAVEMIILASHLLGIVDKQAAQRRMEPTRLRPAAMSSRRVAHSLPSITTTPL